MYIPAINKFEHHEDIVDFMQRFSFATIITTIDNIPVATHLPFIVKQKGDELLLISHFAKANEQWKAIENCENLVIFAEPHAYISPQHYEKTLNVPTWNYIAVHAYGKATLVTDYEDVIALLESTIETYELPYKAQWNTLSEGYKVAMCKGIVAFEIVVNDLQAKKKLSQNKTDKEQDNIIHALAKSTDSNERIIGEYMKKA